MTGAARRARLSGRGKWGLAFLVAACALMAAAAAAPFLVQGFLDEELAARQLDLRFLEAKLKLAKVAQPVGFTAADDIDPLFAGGDTSGTGLAGLQSLLGRLAQDTGMTIERTQPLQTDASEGMAVLRMEVEAVGSLESLRGFLLAIETGEPLLFVRQAKITAPQSAEGAATLPSDVLTASLQLETYGWWGKKP